MARACRSPWLRVVAVEAFLAGSTFDIRLQDMKFITVACAIPLLAGLLAPACTGPTALDEGTDKNADENSDLIPNPIPTDPSPTIPADEIPKGVTIWVDGQEAIHFPLARAYGPGRPGGGVTLDAGGAGGLFNLEVPATGPGIYPCTAMVLSIHGAFYDVRADGGSCQVTTKQTDVPPGVWIGVLWGRAQESDGSGKLGWVNLQGVFNLDLP